MILIHTIYKDPASTTWSGTLRKGTLWSASYRNGYLSFRVGGEEIVGARFPVKGELTYERLKEELLDAANFAHAVWVDSPPAEASAGAPS